MSEVEGSKSGRSRNDGFAFPLPFGHMPLRSATHLFNTSYTTHRSCFLQSCGLAVSEKPSHRTTTSKK